MTPRKKRTTSGTPVLRTTTATWVPPSNATPPELANQPPPGSNTAEYWSITDLSGQNEVSLHQWGWSVTTVGGSRYDLPPRRGSDITTAYRPGQIHRRKLPDARPITLLMFMVGFDPATGLAVPDARLQWNDNWDALRRLVYRNHLLADQRFRLYRRWFLTHEALPTSRAGSYDGCIQGDPGVPVPGPRLVTAWINAEMTGTMVPTMTGRFRSDFQLDFTCSDPFFYGDQVIARIDRSDSTSSADTTYVWNDGHDAVNSGYLTVDLVGPLASPQLTNESTAPNSWVKYSGQIPDGYMVRLNVQKFTAELMKTDTTGPHENVIGRIGNLGSRWWVNLLPGSNKFRLTSNPQLASYGYANVGFRHAYV